MTINIIQIILIIIGAGLCWYVNEKLNSIPVLKPIVQVLIVVISVLFLLHSLGLLHSGLVVKI